MMRGIMIYELETGGISISVSTGNGQDFLSFDFVFKAKTLLEQFAEETYEFEFNNKTGRFKIGAHSSNDETNDNLTKYTKEERPHLPEYVYLLKCKRTGYFKIGFSKKLETRLKTLRTSNADIELVFAEKMDRAFENEQRLHRFFENYRISGEWFSLSEEQVDQAISYIKSKAA